MFKFFWVGFWLSIAYFAPIAMQTLDLSHPASKSGRPKFCQAALLISLFYIALAVLSFWGTGLVLTRFPLIQKLTLFAGNIIIIYVGMDLVLSVPQLSVIDNMDEPFGKPAANDPALTWLNPQAIMDGVLLFCGVRACLSAAAANFFILGAAVASLVWLLCLVTIPLFFQNMMSVKLFMIMYRLCGFSIFGYGLTLAYMHLSLLSQSF